MLAVPLQEQTMQFLRTPLPAAIGLALSCALVGPASAQTDAGTCVLAGRITAQQTWAPRFAGVQLLAEGGKVVTAANKQALGGVRQVKLSQPALLSRCDGNNELTRADNEPAGAKAQVPAVSAGLVDVEAVAFPKLRTGGELVELRVRLPAERVVMLTR
jgi:hypothetical protein